MPDVTAYGWELHSESGTSDKFYRFIVFLGDEAGFMTTYGRTGAAGEAHAVFCPTEDDAIRKALSKSREKERGRGGSAYDELRRDFTAFTLPEAIARTTDLRNENARKISYLFGQAARVAGTAAVNASPIANA